MKKIGKVLIIAMLIFAFLWGLGVVKDRQTLSDRLIRLHVVGASDSQEDQAVKLQVRDAIIEFLQGKLEGLDVESAEIALKNLLPKLQEIAVNTLKAAGFDQTANVSLEKEAFPTRDYDTFSLPAGVYRSLRITLGEGEGRNWWCVVFPSLCLPATSEDFSDTAAGAGFSDGLTDTLQQKPQYEIRFFFLDCLGWIQNFFHRA